MRHRVIGELFVALSFLVPASSAAQKKCDPVPAEFLKFGPTFRDCAVDQKAIAPAELPPVDSTSFQPQVGRRQKLCDKVSIDMVISTSGRAIVQSAKVVRSTNRRLEESALKGLPELLYAPAVKDGSPVQQLVRYERVVMYNEPIVFLNGVLQPPPQTPRQANAKLQC